jgi:hypothetical protein
VDFTVWRLCQFAHLPVHSDRKGFVCREVISIAAILRSLTEILYIKYKFRKINASRYYLLSLMEIFLLSAFLPFE